MVGVLRGQGVVPETVDGGPARGAAENSVWAAQAPCVEQWGQGASRLAVSGLWPPGCPCCLCFGAAVEPL